MYSVATRTEALVTVLNIVIPTTVILSARAGTFRTQIPVWMRPEASCSSLQLISTALSGNYLTEGYVDRTAFVTSTGKFRFTGMPSGVCNAPWFFQRMMYVTVGHLGPESGILTYMHDEIVIITRAKLTCCISLSKWSQLSRQQV